VHIVRNPDIWMPFEACVVGERKGYS